MLTVVLFSSYHRAKTKFDIIAKSVIDANLNDVRITAMKITISNNTFMFVVITELYRLLGLKIDNIIIDDLDENAIKIKMKAKIHG